MPFKIPSHTETQADNATIPVSQFSVDIAEQTKGGMTKKAIVEKNSIASRANQGNSISPHSPRASDLSSDRDAKSNGATCFRLLNANLNHLESRLHTSSFFSRTTREYSTPTRSSTPSDTKPTTIIPPPKKNTVTRRFRTLRRPARARPRPPAWPRGGAPRESTPAASRPSAPTPRSP